MVRLYIDQDFEVGKHISLPREERHYYQKVHRGQGEVLLFNRRGQQARGKIKGGEFFIEELVESAFPVWPIRVGLALPKKSVLKSLVSQLSELGVDELVLFAAQRSQSAPARLKDLRSFEKSAIESARQCGRARPLSIRVVKFEEIISPNFIERETKIFFDELEASSSLDPLNFMHNLQSALLVFGCEGGWTAKERKQMLDAGLNNVHLACPVLKVETAVICGALLGVVQLSSKKF